MRKLMMMGSCWALAACGSTPAVITQISDSSLEVQQASRTSKEDVNAKAREGCGLYKEFPTYVSTVDRDGLTYHLFSCTDRPGQELAY